MAKYVYIYKGGRPPETDAERERLTAAWIAFVGGLGDALVDGGSQFAAAQSVNGNGTPDATGYTVIDAASIDAAIDKARPCPIFETGGDVEVYETIEM